VTSPAEPILIRANRIFDRPKKQAGSRDPSGKLLRRAGAGSSRKRSSR
jgi:hypothetical protein